MKAFPRRQPVLRDATALLAVVLGIHTNLLSAAEKEFSLHGATLTLEEASTDLGVLLTSMRFNRAANVWNVEASLTNRSAQSWQGPFVMVVESVSGTSGIQQPDGLDVTSKPYFDLSALVVDSAFASRETSFKRTLTLGFQAGAAPQISVKVFARAPPAVAGLSLVRTLDAAGLPLPSVHVDGAGAAAQTDETFGLSTLTLTNAPRVLRFSAPGFLPVWRIANVTSNAVGVIPHPRLTRPATNTITITPIAGGRFSRGVPPIEVNFAPGAFSQDTVARLTPLTGQTLPLFLPPGWSPLAAWWLELSTEPAQPGTASVTPWGPIAVDETAVLVRLNTNTTAWEVLQVFAGKDSSAVSVAVPGSGAFALVVPDGSPIAPPAPTLGATLSPSTTSLPDAANLRAGGTVTPSSSPVSKTPELVTGTAEVWVTNLTGNLPSGTLLRGEVSERYTLRDGTRRFPALFDNFVVGYQRPGNTRLDTVRAEFPVRPVQLFGAEALQEAVVFMDLFAPGVFSGSVLGTNGGQVASEGLRVLAGLGDLLASQAVQLKRLAVTNFVELVGSNAAVVAAFELSVNGIAAGRKLVVQLGGLATNADFVLARVLEREGFYGLEPRERLHSDGAGNLVTREPASGDKLPGLNGAGQELSLLQVQQPLGLLTGTGRASNGQPGPGLLIRVAGEPWLAITDPLGSFRLIAPVGSAQLVVTDPATGDTGQSNVTVIDAQVTVTANAGASAIGLSVRSMTPSSGATAVPRVTPIVVEFNKAINPGSLGTTGVQLLATNGRPVSASLTLNLANTVATLLPIAQLDPSSAYTVALSTNIADPTGRNLAGPNLFTFTTASDNLNRGLGAQVLSYEPTNGVARIEGTQGIADPNAPVILVNETSGRTSTVLSNPDGSFAGSIAAGVDDMLSAVFVNDNGTRSTVPVSRQIFGDGSVGLFKGGGILEAPGDNGPIQLIVEPGTVASKSKFKLQAVTLANVLALVSNTPPEAGKILGGFKYSQSGDGLTKTPELAFPVKVADLGLPLDVDPTNASYALAIPRTNDGVVTYQIVDRMTYSDGKLVTHYLPFLGLSPDGLVNIGETLLPGVFDLLLTPVLSSFGDSITVAGRVSTAQISYNAAADDPNNIDQHVIPGTQRFLPGALVTARPLTAGSTLGRLQSGNVYAVSGSDGSYALPVAFSAFQSGGLVAVRATHPAFSVVDYPASRSISLPTGAGRVAVANLLGPTDLILGMSVRPLGDRVPPQLSLDHTPPFPQPGETATLRVVATDNASRPDISLQVYSAISLTNSENIHLTDDIWQLKSTEDFGGYGQRNIYSVSVPRAVKVLFKVTAKDAVGNVTDTSYPLSFGGAEPASTNNLPPPDPNDHTGPMVLSTIPSAGAVAFPFDEPITIAFDEPIDRALLAGTDPIQLSPTTSPPTLDLSTDQMLLTLRFHDLKPATDYTLTIGAGVRDLAGNALDQDPTSDGNNAFTLHFRTAPLVTGSLPGLEYGGGAVIKGNYAYVLERKGPLDGAVNVYDLSNPTNPVSVAQFSVPGYPRDLALIPNYSFKRRPDSAVETKDLLAVVGGKLVGVAFDASIGFGGPGVGQYLWIIDISNPLSPQRAAAAQIDLSPSAAVTKVVWSPPRLGYLDIGDFPSIGFINVQSFILGELLRQPGTSVQGTNDGFRVVRLADGTQFQWPIQDRFGTDRNGDGDFVDAGEELPYPSLEAGVLAGLDLVWTVSDTDQFINDFAAERGGEFVGVVLDKGHVLGPDGRPVITSEVPAGYRTLVDYPVNLERQTASFAFSNGLPSRVNTLVISNEVSIVHLALVSVNGQDGDTNRLVILEITDPTAPRELTEIPIPADGTAVYSVAQRSDGLLMLALSRDALLLDPSRFLTPGNSSNSPQTAIVGVIPNAGVGAKTFASSPAGLTVTSLGSRNQIIQSAPTLKVVSFPDVPPFAPATMAATNDDGVSALLEKSVGQQFLMPSRFRAAGCASASLEPPAAQNHYYVLVRAPGGAGPTIELALESLNWTGHPLTKKGFLFPPVHALGTKALADMGQSPTEAEAPVRSCTAWQLSTNKASPFYNLYLSRPFALVYEEMSRDDLATLQAQLDREILWSGAFLRLSLDPAMTINPVLGPFASVVSTADWAFHPGVETILQSFPADYVQSPNPGPVNGWVMLPGALNAVAAHSSELIINTVDLELAGRRLPLAFRRNYSGQGLYDGPFGRGWDFNFNQRIVELSSGLFPPGSCMPLVVRENSDDSESGESGGLLFYTGAGRVTGYKFAGTNAPPEVSSDPLVQHLGWITNTARFYLPPEGAFNLFFKFKDGRYARLEPDGTQFWYNSAGRLIKVYDRYEKNALELIYNLRGELIRIFDELRRPLEIGYWRPADDLLRRPLIDEMTSNPSVAGKICRLLDYSKRDIRFYYTDDGLLDRREGFAVETGVNASFVGRQVTRYLYSNGSNPDRSAKSLIGVVGGDEAGTPLISAGALGQSGRDTVGQINLGANAVSVTLGQPNTALALSHGGASSRVATLDGGTTDYTFDRFGRPLQTIVGGSGAVPLTNHTEFYPDGQVKSVTYPEGNSIEYEYDSSHPSVRARANLIKVTRRPGPRGGPVLVATGQFDNWYNLPAGTKTDYNGNISTIQLTPDHRSTAAIILGTDEEMFEVNEFGQIVRHTAVDGVETRQTYNSDGFLATRSVGSLTTTYSYANLNGGVSDPGLRGLPSIITDPKGNPTTRIYDERNQLVRESRGGGERTYSYDVAGRVVETTTIVDTNRVLVSRESYNQFGFLTARTVKDVEVDGVPRDLTVRYIPDLFNRVKEIDWPSGQRDLIDYDPLGRVARYAIEGAYAESYGYDGNGNLTTHSVGPSTQTLVHDGHDRLIRQITPMGTVIELGLDGNGNVLSKTVLDSQTNLLSELTNTVDVLNRVRTTTRLRNDGSSTMRYDYFSTNRSMVITDALGAVVTNFYDNVGRPERTISPTMSSEFSYDSGGNLTQSESQEGGRTYVTQHGYNPLNQLTSITNNLGDVSRRIPGLDGRLLQSIDREGNRTTNSYRLTGELTATAAPTGVRIDYSYATNNQLDSIRDPSANASTYSYDVQSRLLQVKLPDSATTTFTNFNELAAPTLVHMPRGVTVESAFDLEGKLTNRVISGFGPTRAETYQYDGMQRLVRVTERSGEMDFTYDLFGFIREIRQRYLFASDPPPTNNLAFSVQQDADAGGFRSRVVYPYGSVVITNRRDQVGRLLGLSASSGEPIVKSTAYLGDTLVGQCILGEDRIRCQMEYDGLQRPILRRYARISDGTVLTDIRYHYDREGAQRVRQFVDRSGRADFFVYDGGYRLTRADLGVRPSLVGAEPVRDLPGFSQPAAVPGTWSPGRFARAMTYSAGDVLQGIALRNPDQVPTPLSASTFSAPDALSFVDNVDGFARTRDEVGNVTRTRLAVRVPGQATAQWVGANLSYNDLGQLVKIERDDGVVLLNEFGPDGLRIRRKTTGDPTRCAPSDIAYLYDSGRLIEERDLANGATVLARYYYGDDGDELIAGDFAAPGSTNTVRRYFLTDSLKSVMAVADATGNVIERMSYDAWGQPTLQARDDFVPQVARVFLETNSLVLEFSESVLPAFADPAPSTNLVTALKDPNSLFQISVGGQPVSGRVRFEENLPGHVFGSVFRFIPDQPMSGTVQLAVNAGAVQDDWNNGNTNTILNLDLGTPPGTPLFSGPAPGSTAPTELGRSAVNLSFLFHGQYFDYDSGLLYCRARFYDPPTGMFLQPDPAGFTDGVDHYAGFAHNPINLRDPTGSAAYEWGQSASGKGEAWVKEGNERGGVIGFIKKAAGYGTETVGAVLQLGTGTAEGFDLLNSKRPGSWGVLDRMQGGRLVISDAQTAVAAGTALYVAGSAAVNKMQGYFSSRGARQRLTRELEIAGEGDFEIEAHYATQKRLAQETGASSVEYWQRGFNEKAAARRRLTNEGWRGKRLVSKGKVPLSGEGEDDVGLYDAFTLDEEKLAALKKHHQVSPSDPYVLLTEKEAWYHGFDITDPLARSRGANIKFTSDADAAALIVDGEVAGPELFGRYRQVFTEEYAASWRRAGRTGVPNFPILHGAHINQADLVAAGASVNGVKVDWAYAEKVGGPGPVWSIRYQADGNVTFRHVPKAEVWATMEDRWNKFGLPMPASWNK